MRVSDRIILEGMQFYAYHGANEEERALGQPFVVDVEVEYDSRKAAASDKLEDTVSYSHLYRAVKEVMEGVSRNLLEALAEAIAQQVLEGFPVAAIRVKVKKTRPPIRNAILAGAAVEIYRRKG